MYMMRELLKHEGGSGQEAHLQAPSQGSLGALCVGRATAGLQLGWQEPGDAEVVAMVSVETCLGRAS